MKSRFLNKSRFMIFPDHFWPHWDLYFCKVIISYSSEVTAPTVQAFSRVIDPAWPILPWLFPVWPCSYFSVRPLDSLDKVIVTCVGHRKPGHRAATSQTMRSPLWGEGSLKPSRQWGGFRREVLPQALGNHKGSRSGQWGRQAARMKPSSTQGRRPERRTYFLLALGQLHGCVDAQVSAWLPCPSREDEFGNASVK